MTANGHDDLPGEQGNANAVGATGIDTRIATGLPESEHDATGSGPKTVTARGRTAIETRPASDALDSER